MYASKCILSVFLVACVAGANADVLESWGEGTQGVDFDWDPDTNRLTIFHGWGLDYKFWVHDGSEEPGTGVIDNITVHQDATGDFTLLIQEEYGGPGALDWNEGDLRYGAGTSTVTGVQVAGNLGVQDEWIRIERLDGSIDVEGTTTVLEIQEWASPSPACIHLVGQATSINLEGACAGDIVVDNGITYLEVKGDLSGSLDIDGYGNVNIFGDVLDSGDNHVRLGTVNSFECNDMELSDDPDRWLTFAPQVGAGRVEIHGTLSGVVGFLEAPYGGYMTVGTIDAGPQADPDMQYGGIYFAWGTEQRCTVRVLDWFKQGWIFASGGSPSGDIEISGSVGQEDPSTVARILTGWAETTGAPIDFGWDLFVCHRVWPSLDSEAVVYSAGDLSGSIVVGDPGWCTCTSGAMPGTYSGIYPYMTA